MLNIGNNSSYPYTHSNAKESHFSCRYSKEAWHVAGSNNKRLELRGVNCNIQKYMTIFMINDYKKQPTCSRLLLEGKVEADQEGLVFGGVPVYSYAAFAVRSIFAILLQRSMLLGYSGGIPKNINLHILQI